MVAGAHEQALRLLRDAQVDADLRHQPQGGVVKEGQQAT